MHQENFSSATNSRGLCVGWARKDITPGLPVHRSAGPSMEVSERAMDPITATALVLEKTVGNGPGDMMIMVSCDLGMIRQELLNRVRELVARSKPEIDTEKIVIIATHTHVAPCVRTGLDVRDKLLECGLDVPEEWSWFGVVPGHNVMSPVGYLEFAAPRIAGAISEAWENRCPGGISFGLGHAVAGHNRLTAYDDGSSKMYGKTNRSDFSHVEGDKDHSVGLLYTYNADSELTGVVVNIACPAQVSGGTTEITADFWHETRKELHKRLGDSLYILPQIAAAGDQSPKILVDNRAEARMQEISGQNLRVQIAMRITDAVTSTLPSMEQHIDTHPVLNHRVAHLELPRRLVSKEEFDDRRQEFERLLAEYRKMREEIEKNPDIREKPRWFNPISKVHWKLARAVRVMNRYEQQTEPVDGKQYWRLQGQQKVSREELQNTTLPVPVHIMRIGDMAMATSPFELYLDYGQQIKARSKAVQTFNVELANGYYQYLPTERSVSRGAYGAVPESNQVPPRGGRELVEKTLALIESLF